MLTFDEIQIGDKIGQNKDKVIEVVMKVKKYAHIMNGHHLEVILFKGSIIADIVAINLSHLNDSQFKIWEKGTGQSVPKAKTDCTCDIMTLMRVGCKCGNFNSNAVGL